MDADREKFEQIANAPLKRHHIYTDQYDDLRTNELWSIWQAALAHRAAQPAGVEDAERMEWLERTNPVVFHKSWEGDKWEIAPVPYDAYAASSFSGDTLREAIDAARLASKGEAA